jgi:hypothetical protein
MEEIVSNENQHVFIYTCIDFCYMFRPMYRSSSGIHTRTVNKATLYIKISYLNTDPYCAIGVIVADEYHNRMTANFYHVRFRLKTVSFIHFCVDGHIQRFYTHNRMQSIKF